MHESNIVLEYLEQITSLLGTPAGLACLLVLLATLVAAIATTWGKWFCLIGCLYASTLPVIASTTVRYAPLAPPLEQLRAYARPITYVFMAVLLLPLLTSVRGWRIRLVHLPLILFFLFDVSISLRLTALGNAGRGLIGLSAYILLFLTLGLGVARWLQTVKDVYTVVWVVSIVGAIAATGCFYQLVVNSSVVIINKRLIGISGNPQGYAVTMAFILPFVCFLASKKGNRRWVRPLLLAVIAVMSLQLVWTGSRTGALSAVVGLIVLFHRNLGRFVLLAPAVVIAIYLVMPYLEGSQEIASRLVSSQDTRSAVWSILYDRFQRNMLFGASTDVLQTAENSYLSSLSEFGIIGTLPLVGAMIALGVQLARLHKNRRLLGDESFLVDLVTASWATIGVAAMFEGLLLGIGTLSVFLIYMMASVTGFLTDWTTAASTAPLEENADYALAA